MAADTTGFVVAQTTAQLLDYTGTPVATDITTLIEGSLAVLTAWGKERQEIWVTSSTGQSLWSRAVKGIAQGQTISWQMAVYDVNDSAEVDAVCSLLRELEQDDTSGGAFSAQDYSSQLTGGGSLQVKLAVTERNQAGVSHVTTIPITIDSTVDGNTNGFKTWTVTGTVVGAITLT